MLRGSMVVVVGALAVVGSAWGSAGFTDPANDSPGGGDIRSVSVGNNTQTQVVSFRVTIGGMPALVQEGDRVQIWFNVDRNAATGLGGVDCLLGLARDGWYEARWTAGAFKPYLGGNLPVISYRNGTLLVAMNPADCRIMTKRFSFRVVSFRGDNVRTAVKDFAPDTGFYPYSFGVSPTALSKTVITVNGPPRVGSIFMVIGFGIYYADGTSRYADGVTCSATLGSTKLRGDGVGGCQFQLASNAKGKKLVVHVLGKTPSATYRKTVTYTVK